MAGKEAGYFEESIDEKENKRVKNRLRLGGVVIQTKRKTA